MNRFLTFLLSAIVLLSSCKIQDVDFVAVNDYNINRSNDNQVRLKLNVKLNNPNSFNIKVKKAKLSLDINGNDGGEIKLANNVTIEKNKEGDYDFILGGDPKQIGKAIAAASINIALSGKATITVKGWVKGKAFGLGKKIEINEKKSISLKDLNL